MTDTVPPGKPPGPKGFIGDDDLFNELDAWDATFDQLHDETGVTVLPTEQVMKWPAPAASNDLDTTNVARRTPPAMRTASEGWASDSETTGTHEVPRATPAPRPPRGQPPAPIIDRGEPGDRLTVADLVTAEDSRVEISERDRPTLGRELDREVDREVDRELRPGRNPRAAPTASPLRERRELVPTHVGLDARDPAEVNAAETDFSHLGVDVEPHALGDLLGRTPTAPPIDAPLEDDDDAATRLHKSSRITQPPPVEDDVLTSASRPVAPADGLDDDSLAPPPPPKIRTPAIVRRMPATISPPIRPTPPNDRDAFAEDTRILDDGGAGMPAFTDGSIGGAADEDDYADIEIGAEPEISISAAPEATSEIASAPVGRRTAHVLRRTEKPTRPPPIAGVLEPTVVAPPVSAAIAAAPPAVADPSASMLIEIVSDRDAQVDPLAGPPVQRISHGDDEHDFSDLAEPAAATDYREPSRPTRTAPPPIASPSASGSTLGRVAPVERRIAAPEPKPAHEEDDDFAPPHAADRFTRRTGEGEAADPARLPARSPPAPLSLSAALAVDDDDDLGGVTAFAPDGADDDATADEPAEVTIPAVPAVRPAPLAAATAPAGARTKPSTSRRRRRGVTVARSCDRPAGPPADLDPAATEPSLPAPVAMYARVKTPTSVPPLGNFPGLAGTGPMKTLLSMPAPVAGPGAAPTQLDLATAALPASATTVAIPGVASADDATPELEPALELDALALTWPEQLTPLRPGALDESAATALLIYERELATVDETASSAALRIEAGRLSETLSDLDRARTHYDAALLVDPRATAALRGLRRIARASGDLVEATHHLDAEIAVAGALERRPLGHYRVDLLMASGDQDLARVAVGEILDGAPSDVRALLAQLELAFLDGRADEFGHALEQLAHAVADAELRSAVQSARAVLAALGEPGVAAGWFAAAAESDPASLAARLGAVRHAIAHGDPVAAATTLLDLARQVETSDPITAAAFAVRAQQWAPDVNAANLALAVAPADPLVARLAVETALAQLAQLGGSADADPMPAAEALVHWATTATVPAERAYAAAFAAELAPARNAELWSVVLALEPGDDYAAAQLRTSYVAGGEPAGAIAVDLAIGADGERERARLRAAYGLIGANQLGAAIDNLREARALRPTSMALAEALAEALAADGRWLDRARLAGELAEAPGEQLDRDVAQLRSALAWEEAVGALVAAAPSDLATASEDERMEIQRATVSALEAWERVLEHDRAAAPAHAGAILLATRLGDREVLGEVLARAQTAETSPWAIASLALRRARLVAVDDPTRAESILRDAASAVADDPRRTVELMLAAARRGELGDAAAALEERASHLASAPIGADSVPPPEIAALRLRAAQLALDAGDAARATTLLGQVEHALPQLGVVPDLLAAARRRSGDRPTAGAAPRRDAAAASSGDAFARLVRDADLAASQGDGAGAVALYQRALELRPDDPIAAVPLTRVATQLGDPAPVASLALAQLRAAEAAGDAVAKAEAYALLADIDGGLRNDPGSAQVALESAAQADPSRLDLLHRLERAYAAADQTAELLRVRRAEIDASGTDDAAKGDRAALLVDLAGLAARDARPDTEVADHYRAALAAAPRSRQALLHLEQMVRRAGASAELARLEIGIAAYFDGDARTQATFLTRAGETLAELGQIDAAVVQFGLADQALPGHRPALEGWRQAALKGDLWIDVAEAATRQAQITDDKRTRNELHHLAGVALMDKALVGDRAMSAFRRALDAEPGDRDSFLRLRILLEEDANHDDLATLLARRLEVETDAGAKIELHRALAELHRNFLSDRDTAKLHYRAILADDPNDLRAHAAIADIAWEQGAWQEAADELVARARLERAPDVLKTLCYRLGLIYADRLVDIPLALRAFQRALTYQPDDEATLIRLADLATAAGEWKLALGACERLVKNSTDPDLRASHLHRVARIFKVGFGDAKRAERALQLALDGAPTNDDALTQLVQFYREAGDITSVRVHLGRVAGAMRARAGVDPNDGLAYRVIARAMAARVAAGVEGSMPIARAAAELAELFGTAGEPETRLLATPAQPDLSMLQRPEADEVLFPRTVPAELRQIFVLLGDRVAKHVGVDLRPYGATRGDRLRARDNPVASVAQSVATALGFGEIDVYLSSRQPWAMVAEPTSPVSLVIGASVGQAGGDSVRFAAGSALKLAQAALAIPARLAVDDLGTLVVALLRLFQPEFPLHELDGDAVTAQTQKLRRLIPTGLFNELRPFALGIDSGAFDHRRLALDLRVTGMRAGLVAAGSLMAGLRLLAAQAGQPITAVVADPVAQGLISFALSEDLAAVAR